MRNKLMSRQLDFWLLGGASILIWALMKVFKSTDIPTVVAHKGNLPALAASLSLLVNFPHFMASYDIAYSRGRDFIRANWFQLIFVPAALIFIAILGWNSMRQGLADTAVTSFIVAKLVDWGLINGFTLQYKTGQLWLGFLVNMMFFTVGWHYSKQVFGCAMVYAKYDEYPLTNFQRNLVRYNVMSIWWITFMEANSYAGSNRFFNLSYPTLGLWSGFRDVAVYGFFATLAAGALFIVVQNYRKFKKWPSLNFLVPIFAFYVWWLPWIRVPELYMSMVPLFHSLQYMVFVARIKTNEATVDSRIDEMRLTRSIFFLILTGWCAFELFPNLLDRWMRSDVVVGVTFFILFSHLFINIHHYFIDNVIWRLRDGHVRKSLFGG